MLPSSIPYQAGSWLWHHVPANFRQRFWNAYFDWKSRGAYQQIRFRDVTFVKGQDRSKLYKQLLPTPPVGKSLLDAGSCYGYYPLRAIEEGARYCRAIERNPQFVAKMTEVATKLKIRNFDVVQADIVDYTTADKFDIVICLNVLHHLETIERVEKVLTKLYEAAQEQMMLVVLSPDDLDQPYVCDHEPDEWGERLVRLSPIYFINKYGQQHVKVMTAKTYSMDRKVIIVSKPTLAQEAPCASE